jgi:hypothetical protein
MKREGRSEDKKDAQMCSLLLFCIQLEKSFFIEMKLKLKRKYYECSFV